MAELTRRVSRMVPEAPWIEELLWTQQNFFERLVRYACDAKTCEPLVAMKCTRTTIVGSLLKNQPAVPRDLESEIQKWRMSKRQRKRFHWGGGVEKNYLCPTSMFFPLCLASLLFLKWINNINECFCVAFVMTKKRQENLLFPAENKESRTCALSLKREYGSLSISLESRLTILLSVPPLIQTCFPAASFWIAQFFYSCTFVCIVKIENIFFSELCGFPKKPIFYFFMCGQMSENDHTRLQCCLEKLNIQKTRRAFLLENCFTVKDLAVTAELLWTLWVPLLSCVIVQFLRALGSQS